LDKLRGTASVPSSKSLTNRALIAAAAAQGGTIENPLDCEDSRLLASALLKAGWELSWQDGVISVGARKEPGNQVVLDLGNSGTGSRLIMALLAAVDGNFVLDGALRLRERPMEPLIEALAELGADIQSEHGFLPVKIRGKTLNGGRLSLKPQMSSQFVSGLAMAAPLMREGLELRLEGEVPSRPYLMLTHDVLLEFGASVDVDESLRNWRVGPGGLLKHRLRVEGDWSASAFFLCAAALLPSTVEVVGLDLRSHQGDRAICGILENAGVRIESTASGIRAIGPAMRGLDADLSDTPDLFPALASVISALPFVSELRGLEHLKHKECDRLSVIVENLRGFGAEFDIGQSCLKTRTPVNPAPERTRSATSAADHRIAMAMAVVSLVAGPIEIDDSDCVQKSFPGFWAEWNKLVD
jgi:3-phosphoshikimate 1-carboxyvinyltransferase